MPGVVKKRDCTMSFFPLLALVAVAGVILFVAPWFVLRLTDDVGALGCVARRTLGAVSVLVGVTILASAILAVPSLTFEEDYWLYLVISLLQLGLPVGMVLLGWKWLVQAPVDDEPEDDEDSSQGSPP
jgi:hypothetical protein